MHLPGLRKKLGWGSLVLSAALCLLGTRLYYFPGDAGQAMPADTMAGLFFWILSLGAFALAAVFWA